MLFRSNICKKKYKYIDTNSVELFKMRENTRVLMKEFDA